MQLVISDFQLHLKMLKEQNEQFVEMSEIILIVFTMGTG